jgi:hypothetical protein
MKSGGLDRNLPQFSLNQVRAVVGELPNRKEWLIFKLRPLSTLPNKTTNCGFLK